MGAAAFILAFLKAIPAAMDLFHSVQELYYGQQDAADQNHYSSKKIARDAILAKMRMPGVTDAELKDCRRALYELGAN